MKPLCAHDFADHEGTEESVDMKRLDVIGSEDVSETVVLTPFLVESQSFEVV